MGYAAAAPTISIILFVLVGCERSTAPVVQPAMIERPPATSPLPKLPLQPPQPIATVPVGSGAAPQTPSSKPASTEFILPQFDEDRVAAAGLRKIAGKHLVFYTDLPSAPEIDELPQVFDAAVPLWCDYFAVDPARINSWKIVGCLIQSRDRFANSGLFPEDLPPFPHGYSRGGQLWLYDQPSAYYRRHLLLHEGTHCFMHRWLGGAGPPWYTEGIAELLATHRWQGGRLTLAVMPRTKEEVPYWGRIKIIKDEVAAGRNMTLAEILRYDAKAHLRTAPYAWCWAAAAFLDQHPLTQSAFRDLRSQSADYSPGFSRQFSERLQPHWPHIDEEWQLFIAECDYGYDVARSAVVRKDAVELPAAGATATIVADRGWQSAGYRLKAGSRYQLISKGRYTIAEQPRPWPCEPGGVTIRYHRGQPLGKLLAAVSDAEGDAPGKTPLADSQPIGLAGELAPLSSGTLYLKINEPASGLADNSGSLEISVRECENSN